MKFELHRHSDHSKTGAAERPTFLLRLRPEPNVDGIRALRRALKFMLRACGLRAISVERVP